jgi:hypothetical protein
MQEQDHFNDSNDISEEDATVSVAQRGTAQKRMDSEEEWKNFY